MWSLLRAGWEASVVTLRRLEGVYMFTLMRRLGGIRMVIFMRLRYVCMITYEDDVRSPYG
jgi:hypothetical protein